MPLVMPRRSEMAMLTRSSPPATPPYKVDSAMLASMPFRTLISQTPSQLHSSCCFAPGSKVGVSASGLLLLWCARQAFQAPELPAASNGSVSKVVSSSKELFRYCRTSRMLVGWGCDPARCGSDRAGLMRGNEILPKFLLRRSLPVEGPCRHPLHASEHLHMYHSRSLMTPSRKQHSSAPSQTNVGNHAVD